MIKGLTKRLTKKEFLSRVLKYSESINYDFSSTHYINTRSSVSVECNIHGKFICNPVALMKGLGCKFCIKDKNPKKRICLNLNEYKIVASNCHKNKYDYSLINEHNFKNEKLPIICPKHGMFLIRKSAHISITQLYGCQRCSHGYSKAEERIETFLKDNSILYEYQKGFFDLTNQKNQKLLFDFYIPSRNLLIEYDGPHHYMLIKFGRNQTREKQTIKYTKVIKNDTLKNLYTFDKGVDLLRICYDRDKDIEKILGIELLNKSYPDFESPLTVFRIDNNGRILPGKHIDYSYRNQYGVEYR
jgi:hypothetical protein